MYHLLLLLGEGVRDLSHAISGGDHANGSRTANNAAKLAGLVCDNGMVQRITKILNSILDHKVHHVIPTLEDASDLATTSELDANLLVEIRVEIDDRVGLRASSSLYEKRIEIFGLS